MSLWIEEEIAAWDAKSRLDSACSYALTSPGKRFRPVLSLACAEMLGIERERVKKPALAVEFIHAFSLVHDDLPAIDNDAMRRGQPTTHIEFDEATALLAGDALLSRAFLLLAGIEGVSAKNCKELIRLISNASLRLCHGQSLDLLASGAGKSMCLSPADELKVRHLNKTGALMVAALCSPLFLNTEEINREVELSLQNYGENLGLLFQITDDILDATKSSEELGKPSGSDIRQGTPTYMSVFGLEQSQALALESAKSAACALAKFGREADFLRWLVEFVRTRPR